MLNHSRSLGQVTLALSLGALFSACGAGQPPVKVALGYATLGNCPARPNCVSTADRDSHYIPPFEIVGDPGKAWQVVTEVVAARPRTHIATRQENYLRAECSSLVFRFVDDLELMMHPDRRTIHIRSGSRIGYKDFGVNRARVEEIREALRARGVVR